MRVRGFDHSLILDRVNSPKLGTVFNRSSFWRFVFFIGSLGFNAVGLAFVFAYFANAEFNYHGYMLAVSVLASFELLYFVLRGRLFEILLGLVLFSFAGISFLAIDVSINRYYFHDHVFSYEPPMLWEKLLMILIIQIPMFACWVFYGWTRIWGGVYDREPV